MDEYLKYDGSLDNDSDSGGDQIPNNSANFSRTDSYAINEDDDMQKGLSNNDDMKLCIRLITSAYKIKDFDLIDEIITDMVSKSNIPGLTKLHSVSGYGFSELVERYLIQLEIDPNAECVFNELGSITPLHFCAGIGPDPISPDRNKCIDILVKHGANIDHQTTRKDTALHWACKVSDKGIVETLLKNGANINALNSDNCTCAHGAAFYKNLDVLQLLIEHNVDTTVADCSGKTLLHLLCKDTVESKVFAKRSDYDLLLNDEFESMDEKIDDVDALARKKQADTTMLIQIITDLVVKHPRESINTKDCNGFTPVMYACEYGNVDILKLIIKNGADINITSSEGVTCLLLAIVNAEVDIVRCLIENGFDTKKDNCSYLTDAAFLNDIDIVKLLIDAGFDVNETKQDENGAILNPLWAACEKSNVEIVKVLLTNGANCIIRPDLNMTALHCVAMAQYESIECAQILVDHKCPINARTTDAYETPLFLACNSGYKDIAAYLIQLGVDPNSCSTASRTCFQQAVYKGFRDIVKLLIDNHYRLTSEDRTSCSILIKDLYHDGDVDMLKYLSVDTKTIDKEFLLQSIQEISAVESLKTKPSSIGDLESYLQTKLTIDDPK